MCGIIAIIGQQAVDNRLVEGLRRLEYRGYDSAGIATLENGVVHRCRAEGKLDRLAQRLSAGGLAGSVGIGHTRWATHGAPTESNAHPHLAGRVAIVHNGIIENHRALRTELESLGCRFATDTDSEVIAHLIDTEIAAGRSPRDAVLAAVRRLRGAYALAVLFAGEGDLLIGARRGSPLAVGFGEGETFLGSDALALAPLTRRLSYLEDGDVVVLTRAGAAFFDAEGNPVTRAESGSAAAVAPATKGEYRHFMLKEIHDQPVALAETLRAYMDPAHRRIILPDLPFDLAAVPRLTLTACGTAYFACRVGRYWLEQIARLPVDADIGSEFRYRQAPMTAGGATFAVSQSGETADTLAALRYAAQQGQVTGAIVNVAESTIARESDCLLATHAGAEIGVASTKAFTAQLAVLACLTVATARARGAIGESRESAMVAALAETPARLADGLAQDDSIARVAGRIAAARTILYMGRGTAFPLAVEGALKLKELTYLHAEGYAAGELKHGALALVDSDVPVVVLAPPDPLREKTFSNMEEVIARGGQVILISDKDGIREAGARVSAAIEMPPIDPFTAPLLYALPIQLLAYHAAVALGRDVDQPRNLAKSVTVE